MLFSAAHCGGSAPTWMGFKSAAVGHHRHFHAGPVRQVGDEPGIRHIAVEFKRFAAQVGIDDMRRIFMAALQVERLGRSPATFSSPLSRSALRCRYHSRICAYLPGFQPVPWVQYFSMRSGRLRNHQLYSELCPLDSVT